jgi:hypothetical protein
MDAFDSIDEHHKKDSEWIQKKVVVTGTYNTGREGMVTETRIMGGPFTLFVKYDDFPQGDWFSATELKWV